MPRIRTIKPEFWQDEKLSLLDPLTRLVFLGLISLADDKGRVLDNLKYIDGQIFPNTDDTSRDSLEILARLSRVLRYRVASGQSVIQITNWSEHQRVDHPSQHVLPGPDVAVVVQPKVPQRVESPDDAALAHDSRDPRDSLARSSRSDLGPRTMDHGPTTKELSRGKRALVPTVDEERVLAHYRTTHPMRRPGERDLRAIRAALKRGYGPEELCAAIDGNAADEWHRDRHKHELPYVLREGKIDDFREAMATANQPLVDPETGLLNDHGSRRLGLTRTH
jgi:hypothetical protein